MFNSEINKVYDIYVNMNKDIIHDKMLFLEDFRNREEQLKEYYLALSLLEKKQLDIGFSILEKEFTLMTEDLKLFDCNNINIEIQKVNKYIYLLEDHGEEIKSITKRIKNINNLWKSFLSRNTKLKSDSFELFFEKQFLNLKQTLNELSLNEISTAVYKIDKLFEYIKNVIYCIEKIESYKKIYVFLGDKGLAVKKSIDNISKIETTDINEILSELNQIIANVELTIKESEYGTIGFPVYKAIDRNDKSIERFTIKINDILLKIDPFFNSSSLDFYHTGEYLYLDNFPSNGVFAGRKIIENLNLSKNYISFILKYKETAELFSSISLIFLLILTIFNFELSNIVFAFITTFVVISYFLTYKHVLVIMKDFVQKKFNMYEPFVFQRFALPIFHIGENIDPKSLIKDIVKNFDNIFLNNLKGDYKWIKKYQSQKNR